MKPETILNTLILSLSVSTVLITLISYLIYKMKQFPKNSREVKEATKKEGTFFRRHIPGEVVTEASESKQDEKRGKFSRFNTLPFYFTLLAFVIFSSLIFKDVFMDFLDGWKRDRQITKIHELKDKNLLNLYDFDSSKKSTSLTERISEGEKNFFAQKVLLLREQKFTLLVWPNNRKLNGGHVSLALEGWSRFLTKHGLNFKVTETTEDFSSDVYIVPQARSLSTTQKAYLEQLLKKEKSILFTGPCGVVDGTGEKVSESWCEKRLSLSFSPHDITLPTKPTIFASRRSPGWMVPPGLLMSWLPQDESFRVTATKEIPASAFEANFNGKLTHIDKALSIRSLFQKIDTAKVGWLALEPHGLGGKSENEVFYGETALVDSLSWLSKGPHLELSYWKGDHDHVMVFSVDSESEIEGSYAIWKVLKETATPGTFFVVSEQLKNDDRLTKIKSPLLDVGSHSLDHSIMTSKKIDAQFNNIQESRLVLEEKFERPIIGFHPPEERFNEDTVNVALQNGFQYFVGDQRFFRMAPMFLDPKLVYFPRVFKDDILIKKNRGLVTNEEVRGAMKEDLDEARFLGGLYYFNSHSQIFGKGYYLEAMKEFLSQKYDGKILKTTFGDLGQWWNDRASLRFERAGKKLLIKTISGKDVDDVVLFVSGKPVKLRVPAGEKGVEVDLE